MNSIDIKEKIIDKPFIFILIRGIVNKETTFKCSKLLDGFPLSFWRFLDSI